jgi:DNA-binding IclR family transcriptional regulator
MQKETEKTDIKTQILEYITSHEGCSQNQVAMALDFCYSYIYQQINKLVKGKKIRQEKKGNRYCLFLVN